METKKMKRKINLSFDDYRAACDEAYSARICNPTVFWNPEDGFYVAPAAQLVPNDDYAVNLAYYNANNGSRSLSGSKREYRPLAHGIREFYGADFNPIRLRSTAPLYCEGTMPAGHDSENMDCREWFWPGKCAICGHVNIEREDEKYKTSLSAVIDEHRFAALGDRGGA